MTDGGPFLLLFLYPTARSLSLSNWPHHCADVEVTGVISSPSTLQSVLQCRAEVNIKEQEEERWGWLSKSASFLLWQQHAHREGKIFVEVNSTLIVYLCSTVQPASTRTVTCHFVCSPLQHIRFNKTSNFVTVESLTMAIFIQRQPPLETNFTTHT